MAHQNELLKSLKEQKEQNIVGSKGRNFNSSIYTLLNLYIKIYHSQDERLNQEKCDAIAPQNNITWHLFSSFTHLELNLKSEEVFTD